MSSSAAFDGITTARGRAFHELTAAVDRMPVRRAHVLVFLMVAFGTLINAIEEYNIGLAAPLLARQWSLSNAAVGSLTTVTFVGMAAGSILAGTTGDRYGRRLTYVYNLAVYTVGALLGAFAPGYGWLLAARFVVGLGLGGELNTGITLVAEFMPTRVRGAAVAAVNVAGGGLGIIASSALAALMLGPLQASLGGPTVAWRWLLGVLAAPAVLVLGYRRWLPESPRHLLVRGNTHAANAVLSAMAANRLRPRSDGPVTRYVDVPQGTQLPREHVRFAEVFQGRWWRHTAVIWAVCAMTFGAQVTVTVFLPTLLVVHGVPVGTSLTYTTIINVGGLLGSVVAAVFGYLFPRRSVLGWGAAVAAAFALALGNSTSLIAALVLGGLLQLTILMLNTTTFVWATELYPTRVRAFGTGAAVTVLLLSAAFVPLLAGTLDDAAGAVGIFVLVGAMYVVMVVATWLGPETHSVPLDDQG